MLSVKQLKYENMKAMQKTEHNCTQSLKMEDSLKSLLYIMQLTYDILFILNTDYITVGLIKGR